MNEQVVANMLEVGLLTESLVGAYARVGLSLRFWAFLASPCSWQAYGCLSSPPFYLFLRAASHSSLPLFTVFTSSVLWDLK